jgi:hypothetical protein
MVDIESMKEKTNSGYPLLMRKVMLPPLNSPFRERNHFDMNQDHLIECHKCMFVTAAYHGLGLP